MASLILSIDAMGGDEAPHMVLDGLALYAERRPDVGFQLHGRESDLRGGVSARGLTGRCQIIHHDECVSMSEKPSAALRRRQSTSLWGAIDAVKTGQALAVVSAGNTGALMAFSMLALRRMEGVHRPAMTAIWPTMKGQSVVLDVGANLEANADQLVSYAIMGEAYARAVTGNAQPSIGLLNIGAEEEKGRDALKLASEQLRNEKLGLNFKGYVEGNDISTGAVDVIVTDGFTGNVALKTAEGTARLVASYVRDALTSDLLSKTGALLARNGLEQLREKMNPSNVNGGVLLGLNGVVVKSHGGTDAEGFATALSLAARLAESEYRDEVAAGLARAVEDSPVGEAAE